MINYTFTDEDVKLVEKFINIKNKGYYCDGKQLTEVYNRILHKSVNVTQCGSCLRQRVNELEAALNHFKQQLALNNNNEEKIENKDAVIDGTPEEKPIRKGSRKGRPK